MSQDFLPLFFCSKESWVPHGHVKTVLRTDVCVFFQLQFSIIQSSKFSCPRRLSRPAILTLGNPPYSYFQNVAIGHVNTPKNLLQNHVGVVNNFFGTCPHSQ